MWSGNERFASKKKKKRSKKCPNAFSGDHIWPLEATQRALICRNFINIERSAGWRRPPLGERPLWRRAVTFEGQIVFEANGLNNLKLGGKLCFPRKGMRRGRLAAWWTRTHTNTLRRAHTRCRLMAGTPPLSNTGSKIRSSATQTLWCIICLN